MLADLRSDVSVDRQLFAQFARQGFRELLSAAVIERNGHVLICQRKRASRHALKWEFPGGKVEPGEQFPEALARELREELEIEARIGDQIGRHEVQYPNGPLIRLHFFRVTEFKGEPT